MPGGGGNVITGLAHPSGRGGGGTPPGSPAVLGARRLRRFVPKPAADDGYRAGLSSDAAHHTEVTRAISGRPARCLANAFTRWAAGEFGFGAQWAGQGAPLARPMRAAELVATLAGELAAASRFKP